MLDQAAVPYQVVLTKADKVGRAELDRRLSDTTAALKTHPAAFPDIQTTSARDGIGIADLRASLAETGRLGLPAANLPSAGPERSGLVKCGATEGADFGHG